MPMKPSASIRAKPERVQLPRIFTEPIADPVLLIVSLGDQYIAAPVREEIEMDLLRAAPHAQIERVPDVTHTETINASLRAQLAWLHDRFAAGEELDTPHGGLTR